MAAPVSEVTQPAGKAMDDQKVRRYPNPSSLSYIAQMPVELQDWEPTTTLGFKEKFKKKAAENPFVPIGIFATTCALSIGLFSFRKGQTQRSQMMMRARVAAQAFTIGAVLVGVALQTRKGNKPSTP